MSEFENYIVGKSYVGFQGGKLTAKGKKGCVGCRDRCGYCDGETRFELPDGTLSTVCGFSGKRPLFEPFLKPQQEEVFIFKLSNKGN